MSPFDQSPAPREVAAHAAPRDGGPSSRSTPAEPLERVTRLVARLLDAPLATLSLAVEGGELQVATAGAEAEATTPTSGGTPLLDRVLASDGLVSVSDVTGDRGLDGWVWGATHGVRSCAGALLRAWGGAPAGALIVMDRRPREWSPEELGLLGELAASAERELRMQAMERELAERAGESRHLIDQLEAQAVELEAQAAELEQQVEEMEALNAELSDSEERFRALAEADPDGIVAIDAASNILYANAALGTIFGYPEEELVGRSLEMLMPERFRAGHRGGTARYVETGRRNISWRGVELVGLRSDGAEIPIEVNFGEYTAAGRRVFAGFISDVTDRKRVEAALHQAKEEAERANEAKSEFLSRMSHELRTPLNSILGFGQLLERRDLAPEESKGVEHILKAGRHLLNLINEVLEIARIEANQQEFSLEAVRVRALVDEALALIRPTALLASIRVVAPNPARHAEACVRADQQRLMQVMLNLLSNAVKYNSSNGTVEVLLVSEGEVATGGSLAIGVRDTGPGIPEDRLEELFVPFSRLDAEDAGIEGTGLGLVLSKRLVEAMGGSLRVESEPGQGSTFWVELPLADDPRERLPATPELRASGPAVQRPPKTVLYMEDNLANLDLVESILQSRPEIHLIPALKGRLGLQLAREHDPDLILLDLHLPDLHGETVLQELSADPRTRAIPVLVISADATPRQVERLRASGVHDYLTKPIDVDQFLTAVDAGLSG